jgi:hypothetical protein
MRAGVRLRRLNQYLGLARGRGLLDGGGRDPLKLIGKVVRKRLEQANCREEFHLMSSEHKEEQG